jgi:hypothetical protein
VARLLAPAIVLFFLLACAPPTQAHNGVPDGTILLLSAPPRAGDYLMDLRVDGFTLTAPAAGVQDQEGVGHIVYSVNGFPCSGACSGGAAAATDATRFHFLDLSVGDYVRADLVANSGAALEPPVGLNLTVLAAFNATSIPYLSIITPAPIPGDYSMMVTVQGFDLAAAETPPLPDAPRTGHIVYTLNGQDCAGACAQGQASATDATLFTFYGLVAGDRVAAELVDNAGHSLAPPVRAVQQASVPNLFVTSGTPVAGNYTMRVVVTGMTIAAPNPNLPAGFAHLVYTLNGLPCNNKGATQGYCGTSRFATDSRNFTFRFLKEGDKLGVELVRNDGSSLDPPLSAELTVLRGNPTPYLTPGFEPVAGLLAVALAAFVARRR